MWQEELREQRKGLILEAAATIFAERGYQRATVKEIAAQAGIAPGTIYLYFENKHDLLLTIVDRVIGQAFEQLLAQLAHSDTKEYIATIMQVLAEFAQNNQSFLQALIAEIWVDEELQERFFTQVVNPVFTASTAHMETLIEKGQARKCRAEIVVPAVLGSLLVLAAMRAQAPGQVMADISNEELIEELTQLYIHGLGPAPEA
jgi:TetR/AcrR family fatty acid metabolism transcriptional regulator